MDNRLAGACAAAGVSRSYVGKIAQAEGLEDLLAVQVAYVLTFAPDGSRWTFSRAER